MKFFKYIKKFKEIDFKVLRVIIDYPKFIKPLSVKFLFL